MLSARGGSDAITIGASIFNAAVRAILGSGDDSVDFLSATNFAAALFVHGGSGTDSVMGTPPTVVGTSRMLSVENQFV